MQEGNSLADVMQILIDATGGSKDEFNALWSSSEASSAGFIIASDNGKVFKETLDEMGNSAGKCDEAFNIVSNTSEYKFKKALNELRNSFVKAGESLLPMMDGVSEGIESISKFISKLNPELVTAVAKFGALSLAGGTIIKVFGSVLVPMGKLVKTGGELGEVFIKVTKYGMPLEQAFKTTGTEATSLAGGFVKLLSGMSPLSLGIGAVVTAVAGLGVAFYNNQKEIEESEAKLSEMSDCYDDFTGRIRTNESIWTEIFGKLIA